MEFFSNNIQVYSTLDSDEVTEIMEELQELDRIGRLDDFYSIKSELGRLSIEYSGCYTFVHSRSFGGIIKYCEGMYSEEHVDARDGNKIIQYEL